MYSAKRSERPEKKGLVYIATPKHLRDFLWFYAAGHSRAGYSCICGASSAEDDLFKACERSGIFKKISIVPDLSKAGVKELFLLHLRILFSLVTGRKRQFAERLLSESSKEPMPDFFVCPCDFGLLPGLMVYLARYYPVIQLEEGISEYAEKSRSYVPSLSRIINDPLFFYYWLLSKTDYADCTFRMGTLGDRYCLKYVSHPSLLKYREYREIRKLYDFKGNTRDEYLSLADRAFLVNDVPPDTDLIIFTAVLSDFSLDEEAYVKKMCAYISERFKGKKAVLKRHPRDNSDALSLPDLKVTEIKSSVPGELLIHMLPKVPVISFSFSTVLLEAASQGSPIILFFLKDISPEKGANERYLYTFREGLKLLSGITPEKPEIVDVSGEQ